MSPVTGKLVFAPGARVVVRDAEWVVRRADRSSDGFQQLTCDGVSELVRGQEGVFLTSLDTDIELLDPARTKLVQDKSPGFSASRLFVESQLRQAVPSDEHIHIGHLAAMDSIPYQLDPAKQALRQPRQRILIADAVGLGKTLEAGILVSELIARGRGRRILVLAVKSMLTQFQKEFWNRFTIPLTRLDSAGIRRVRSRIPTNHNPFYYYDKAIISIDTLKQDREYRTYLESAYWDIIVIDEAHNVAVRGGSGSLRSRLAKLLSTRSDTLIMLSATPHDGKARSFASLMNMLDPTAIADPDSYAKEDFRGKGLVVRRFKKDIQGQVRDAFRDRKVYSVGAAASDEEERAFEALLRIKVAGRRSRGGKRDLFAVSLEKALFSSAAACRQTVEQRIKRRESEIAKGTKGSEAGVLTEEVRTLKYLRTALEAVTRHVDSRYQRLIQAIRGKPLHWKPRKPDDRIVIFTERIATMRWLAEGLVKGLKLRAGQLETLHGGMTDIEQQRIVEAFGNRAQKVRVLVCSDVAAEGINLHFRSHRLIHYDMPWSLMVFQQRNGRIDRYGQRETPQIVYLVSKSANKTVRGDQRILEILREKDEQAYKNIGDPSVFMNVHAVEEEEKITEDAIARGEDAEEFDERLTPKPNEGDKLMELFLGGATPSEGDEQAFSVNGSPGPSLFDPPDLSSGLSLFKDDLSYSKAGLHHLRETDRRLEFQVDTEGNSLTLDAPADLQHRFSYFPPGTRPRNWRFDLTPDIQSMSRAIEDSRKNEASWPTKHYLWRQNPVVAWLNDRLLANFGRLEAPVLAGVPGLAQGEVVYAFSGVAPNRKSHPLVCVWGAAVFVNRQFEDCVPLEDILERTGLDRRQIPNRGLDVDLGSLRQLLPEAVGWAKIWVRERCDDFERETDPKLDATLVELEALKNRQLDHLTEVMLESQQALPIKQAQFDRRKNEIDQLFERYLNWVQDTMSLEAQPWVKVLCVMKGED